MFYANTSMRPDTDFDFATIFFWRYNEMAPGEAYMASVTLYPSDTIGGYQSPAVEENSYGEQNRDPAHDYSQRFCHSTTQDPPPHENTCLYTDHTPSTVSLSVSPANESLSVSPSNVSLSVSRSDDVSSTASASNVSPDIIKNLEADFKRFHGLSKEYYLDMELISEDDTPSSDDRPWYKRIWWRKAGEDEDKNNEQLKHLL
ncbi:hypothetical protein BGZ65_003093 [Modicella reniformis]|uniref:Uncharacterized protein n=1 Tax=Modicella reniformis TaxID=1440133 RepID=A0A9P6M9F2_9FUNG|nr:hypothetical protein BGZ65_003093 [Modicella reniformis]